MLTRVGIDDVATLRRMGAAGAFVAVESAQEGVSLNLLYAIAAGLDGRHWTEITADEKGRLLREVEELRTHKCT